MTVLAQLLGVLIVSVGLAVLFKPEILKTVIVFWVKEKRLYLAGLLRIMFGLILLLAAPTARLFWVVTIFGLLTLAKGLLLFVLKPGRVKSLIKWWAGRPAHAVRLLALVTIAMGALLLYAI